ncbi:MAG: hypothetical protein OJF47_000871 [Nitrospira sp.]|nr:MAG: hypothetical protein OJF47_000871 [Nitrospira sp.]
MRQPLLGALVRWLTPSILTTVSWVHLLLGLMKGQTTFP